MPQTSRVSVIEQFDRHKHLLRVSPASLAVLLLSLGATFGVWQYARTNVQQRAQMKFQQETARARTMVKDRLGLYISALHSAQALFAASNSVERAEWDVYMRQENLRGRYPGLTAVCFVERVLAGEREMFTRAVREDRSLRPEGYPDFAVFPPAAARPESYVVKYVYPPDGNEEMLGFDQFSEANRLEAIERCRDTGLPTATSRTELLGSYPDGGFLVFLPIYRNGAPVSTVEERRAAITGVVDAAFRANDLFPALFGEMLMRSRVEMEVYDGVVPDKGQLLYDNFNELEIPDAQYRPRFASVAQVQVADRTWTLRFNSMPGFGLAPAEEAMPLGVLAAGILCSGLFFVLVGSLSAARVGALARAEEAARRLRETRDRLDLVIETSHDAFAGMDEHGRVAEWNTQAETTFGWPRAETLGVSFAERFVPARHRESFERALTHFLESGGGPVLHRRVELTLLHRDGHEFPAQITLGAALEREVYRFHVFVRDVARRKREERRERLQGMIARVLGDSPNLPAAAPRILQAIGEVLGWEVGAFWTVAPGGRELRCLEVWSAPAVAAEGFTTISRQRAFARGVGLPGRVWESGEPAWISDIPRDLNFPRAPIASRDGLVSGFGFPVSAGDQTLGVIEFFTTRRSAADLDLLRFLMPIGRQIGQFQKRGEAEGALAQRTAELVRSTRELEQFATVASHDLQEPLRKIASYTTLLKDRLAGQLDGEVGRFMDHVVDGAVRMRTLINDLLAYSYASHGDLKTEPTNVASVMDETLGRLEPVIREQAATVTYDPLPTVMANGTQIGELLRNLVENALKYRGERTPRIHVSARQKGNEWWFSVTDNGIGVELQYAERIFVMFQRLHSREDYPGTGIGLAICKKIVERHGGRIWVESEPGKGATFFFTIPAR